MYTFFCEILEGYVVLKGKVFHIIGGCVLTLRVCKCDHKLEAEIVGNKAKGRISKRVLPGKQSTPKIRKNEHFLPPDMLTTCAYQWARNVRFSENFACFDFL